MTSSALSDREKAGQANVEDVAVKVTPFPSICRARFMVSPDPCRADPSERLDSLVCRVVIGVRMPVVVDVAELAVQRQKLMGCHDARPFPEDRAEALRHVAVLTARGDGN